MQFGLRWMASMSSCTTCLRAHMAIGNWCSVPR
jgi:hypothetical protein